MTHQRGVALITVLLVVALVSVVAADMVRRQQLSISSAANQQAARQAWHLALGGERLAIALLERDHQQEAKPRRDHLAELWAQRLPPYPVEHGVVRVELEDLSGRFNLNSLVRDEQVDSLVLERFQRLLQRLEISPQVADRLLDWLDADAQVGSAYGAEDHHYLSQSPAYRAANQPLADISELRLLEGLDPAGYQRLRPHVSALPAHVPLNINTASAQVLSSLADSLSLERAQALVKARASHGYEQLSEFIQQPLLKNVVIAEQGLALASQYFQSRVEVQLGERRRVLISLLQRRDDGRVQVLQRDLSHPAQRLGLDERAEEQP